MISFFKKSKLAGFLYVQIIALLAATAVSCIAWFANVTNDINFNANSSILTSYFDSGTGTSSDPYVITRPVHYYNLCNLWESKNNAFTNHNYFQIGKQFNGTYLVYEYNAQGVASSNDATSTSLNMGYYTGGRSLTPIGSGRYPFNGHIAGNNLTIENMTIAGNGRADIGVFGYVTADAEIASVYFSDVLIDCSTPNLNDTGNDHNAVHPLNAYVGYLAGHTVDATSWHNVYINDCRIVNNQNAEYTKKNGYGYFGCVGAYDTSEPSSDINYSSTLNASDVYNYLDGTDSNNKKHYENIKNRGLTTRNTEYSAGSTTKFSSAVTAGTSSYTMAGDTSSTSSTNDYSLATVGYESNSVTYSLTYGSSHTTLPTFSDPGKSPSEMIADGATSGNYIYWDGSNHKWIYYEIKSSGGESVPVQFNCFLMSYVYNSTTYYLKYDNGSLSATTLTLGTGETYPSDPDYYWVFRSDDTSNGVSALTTLDATASYYIYSPNNQKYMTCATGGTYSNPKTPSFTSTFASATQFAIKGPESAITIANTDNNFWLNSSGYIKVIKTTAQNTALIFTFNGGITSEIYDPAMAKYALVTDISTLAEGDIIVIAKMRSDGNTRAISTTQNSNNRTDCTPTVSNDLLSYVATLASFELEGDSSAWYFKDRSNSTYLYTPTSMSDRKNYLRSTDTKSTENGTGYTIADYNGNDATNAVVITNINSQTRYVGQNEQARIFGSYKNDGTSTISQSLHIFKIDPSNLDAITTSGAFQYTANAPSSSGSIIAYQYDVYRNIPGESNYTLFTISRSQATIVFHYTESSVTITWPDEQQDGWYLVKNLDELATGDKLAIVALNSDYGLSTNQQTYNRGQHAVSKDTGGGLSTITFTPNTTTGHNVCELTFGGVNNAWTLYDPDDETIPSGQSADSGSFGYLYAASTTDNCLRTQANLTLSGTWTISINSTTGEASIVSNGDSVNGTMKYDSTNGIFTCYSASAASSMGSICIYRYHEYVEFNGSPIYIGDNISTRYNPQYIDVVGNTTYSENSFNLSNYYSNMYSMAYYENQNLTGYGLEEKFYNTYYTSDAIVITVKNTGYLDLGTLTLTYSGAGTPMLTKGKDSASGASSGLQIGDENGWSTPNLDTNGNYKYELSFSPFNILKACYCTLDSSGNIYSAHTTSGTKTVCYDSTFDASNVASYVIVITNSSNTDMDVSQVKFNFTWIPGNTGDLGSVGYRSATYTNGDVLDTSADCTVNGTILNLYYIVDESGESTGEKVYCKVIYDSTTQTYNITFKSTVACTLNVFNYDTTSYSVTVNGTTYTGGANVINISALTYDASTWSQANSFCRGQKEPSKPRKDCSGIKYPLCQNHATRCLKQCKSGFFNEISK